MVCGVCAFSIVFDLAAMIQVLHCLSFSFSHCAQFSHLLLIMAETKTKI